MSEKIEIERKFLVKFPKSWSEIIKLFSNVVEIQRIEQTYLKTDKDEPAPRIRKVTEGLSGDKSIYYEYNQKFKLNSAAHKEKEKKLNKKQYEKLLEDARNDMMTLSKIRFVFTYNDQLFELDVFKDPLSGLAILEIELKDKNQKIELPPYLNIIKEVTKEKQFNNFELAKKKLFK